jgi:hypothetical protein
MMRAHFGELLGRDHDCGSPTKNVSRGSIVFFSPSKVVIGFDGKYTMIV